MRTAIHITGAMRTFAQCVHTQHWHVFRHYPGADFYISTMRDADTESWRELVKLYPDREIHVDVVESQPEIPEPVEPVRFEPYARSVPVQAVLRQLWQLDRGWRAMVEHGKEYDQYLRVRPDSYFHSYEPMQNRNAMSAFTPWWGRFGGINDRFAVMGYEAAYNYFKTFDRMPQILAAGCPVHPESMVRASMTLAGCEVYDCLRAEFSTLKHDGQRPPEISPIDIAHMLGG